MKTALIGIGDAIRIRYSGERTTRNGSARSPAPDERVWIVVHDHVQLDAMLEKRLEAGEHEGEPVLRINRRRHDRVRVAAGASVLDGDEGAIGVLGLECPLDRCRIVRTIPFHEDPLVLLDFLTSTSAPTPYISQSHLTFLPASSLPLLLENQK